MSETPAERAVGIEAERLLAVAREQALATAAAVARTETRLRAEIEREKQRLAAIERRLEMLELEVNVIARTALGADARPGAEERDGT